MKKKILILSFVLMICLVGAISDYQTYYKIGLDYNQGEINISSVDIEFSQEEILESGFYFAEMLDINREILDITFFDVPDKVLWDGINPDTGEIDRGGLIVLDNVTFEIYVPYYKNALEIVIYDEDLVEKTRINVREYSKEDAIKKDLEKVEESLEDEKELGEEDIESDITKGEKFIEKVGKYWWVLLIVFIILILVLINSLRKHH